jgi:hypothetical protein
MLDELNTLLESKPFHEWQRLLAGDSATIVLPTRENLISGLCVDLGFYLYIRYKVPVLTIGYLIPAYRITTNHVCVLHNGKYYDGWDVDGVANPADLYWSRSLVNNRQVYDKDTVMVQEGLDSYELNHYLAYLQGLKEILKRYPLEES